MQLIAAGIYFLDVVAAAAAAVVSLCILCSVPGRVMTDAVQLYKYLGAVPLL